MLPLPPPADITLELFPTTVEAACERLAEATGTAWKPAGVLRKEVVALRLDHAPYEETRRRFAQALQARWQGDQLVPDEAAARAYRDSKWKESLERHRRSLEYVAQRLAGQPKELSPADVAATARKKSAEEAARKDALAREDWSRAFKNSLAEEGTPAWRAAARVAPALPFSTEKTVYSDQPTAMQKRLPVSLKPIFDQYRRELKTARRADDFARIRVKLEPWGEGSGTTLTFTALGADGKTMDTASIRMNGDNELMNKGGYKEPEIPPGSDLPISEETKSYFQLVNSDFRDKSKRDRARLRLEWIERFSHPEEHEPLVWQRGEAYVRTAAATGKQLVAWMSDFQNLRYDRAGKWVPARFLPPLDRQVTVDGDWMTVGGTREVQGRIDRMAAGRLVQECWRQGGVTVDAAAAFAHTVQPDVDPFLNWVGDSLLALFTGMGGYSALSTTINGNGLRLWGGLSLAQKTSLRQGRSIRISSLGPASFEEVRKAVFEIGAITGEPTDLLPNGMEDGDIALKVTETPLLVGWNAEKGESDEPMPLTAASYGKGLTLGIPYFEMSSSEIRDWNRFRLGVYRDYKLTIRFDRGPSYDDDLTETLFPPSVAPVTALPADMAAEAAKARAEAKPPKKTGQGTTPP